MSSHSTCWERRTGTAASGARPSRRSNARIAPWTIAAGWLAAALWLRDEKARARQIIEAMGDSPEPLWGRVVYHLLTSDLNAAADWYGRMIEHRDPFALVYARASGVEPLRGHPRWPELAA